MQVRLLGPPAIRDDAGAPVELAGTRLRLLVARLALDAGHPVMPTLPSTGRPVPSHSAPIVD